MTMIDLRSDTVTRPSPAMRRAMAEAEVGDDQYGEDPSVNRLEERAAELLGKQAALFVPSGTMANQIALRVFTRPGDDVIVGEESHAVWHESGGAAANAGVQFTTIGRGGLFTPAEFLAAIKPRGHMLYPPTTLLHVENSHNRGGGRVFPQDSILAMCQEARARSISTFLDGARLLNVAVASRVTPASLAAPFDGVALALSKGLGCPVGSVLAGARDMIEQARRHRRIFGGALRQAGILAAAALYALDHNIDRLEEDNRHARAMADRLASARGIVLDPVTVETNIIVFHLKPGAPDAAAIVAAAKSRGVLVNAFGPRTVRCVTHLDVTRAQCLAAADILAACVAG